MTCAKSHAWILNFLSNVEGLDCLLLPNVLPKVSKITDLLKVSKDEKLVSILTYPNSKITINFELLKVSKTTSLKIYSHGEAKSIKFGHQVNLIQRVPLGTLP